MCFQIPESAVVQARDVQNGGKTVLQHAGDLVHAAGHRTGRIFPVADVGEHLRHLCAVRTALGGHFVADAPHHDRGVVAVVPDHVHEVLFGPVGEEAVVPVPAFGNIPFVKGLNHQHQAHPVAEGDQFGGWHVVRRTDGVASHILEQFQLVPQGRFVHGRAQRPQVVVVAHALEFARLPGASASTTSWVTP